MKLLLDAHTLLWWLEDNPTLSTKAQAEISDENNLVQVSSATLWEMHIKNGLDRLRFPDNFHERLALRCTMYSIRKSE
ncbi:MAG: hypothetical protein C4527_12190 [Candidatus Omnitrophota bacterium]|nr:MAG: hypothetical protein C4527_12190 [Candidatus Omnitrophota bacterium]